MWVLEETQPAKQSRQFSAEYLRELKTCAHTVTHSHSSTAVPVAMGGGQVKYQSTDQGMKNMHSPHRNMNEPWTRQPSVAANCNPSIGKEDWSQPAPGQQGPHHNILTRRNQINKKQNKPGETKHYGKTVIKQTLQFHLHGLSSQVNPWGKKGTPEGCD